MSWNCSDCWERPLSQHAVMPTLKWARYSIALALWSGHWLLWVAAALIVGRCQHALAVLMHEDPPLDPELLGLYVGVPLPERTGVRDSTTLPDVIYLFHHNIEHEAGDRREMLEQIAITVYHEVGHYFGFDDDQLEELDFG